MPDYLTNPQLQLAFDFVEQTRANLFLTGRAGTGKTTFLHTLKSRSPKRMIVVAPTGVAAVNAGGVTIHSFFQLPFGPHIPGSAVTPSETGDTGPGRGNDRSKHFSRDKINIIRSLDLLVIDEISMVRADMLDALDEVLRRFRGHHAPFGGVQLLMIGDLQQLAPVAKDDEWKLLSPYYQTIFFFSSLALRKTQFITIELKYIFRQQDEVFINLLNKVRDNNIDSESLEELNKRYIPGFSPDEKEGYIVLTTHNHQSQAINESRLNLLRSPERRFSATIEGDFPEYSYPTEPELVLKKGAQVMFVKNDISREKLFFNGKIGKVTGFDEDSIYVQCEGDHAEIAVIPAEWENNRYTIHPDTREITETPIGRFVQYPLKLAWAITIHKSQGLTFEKAVIDANAAFAHGQVYVALSRCKSMEGMVLTSPITFSSIINDGKVKGFSRDAGMNAPGEQELQQSRIDYQQALVRELFDFSEVKRKFFHCSKLVSESVKVLQPGIGETFSVMRREMEEKILAVSEKFGRQVSQLLAEEPMVESNGRLIERISSACGYFEEQVDRIICRVLNETAVETDNNAVKTALREAFEALFREASLKKAVFTACRPGFTVKIYLHAKALASLEKFPLKAAPSRHEYVPKNLVTNAELYKSLRNWRRQKAEEEDLPEYMVLSQKTMFALAGEPPRSTQELKQVKGFGKKKLQKYGPELMAILRSFLQIEGAEEIDSETYPEEQENPKKQAGQSRRISLEMFRNGNTVASIAKERGLTAGTVESHLSYYVRRGELDIHQLVPQVKLDRITGYLENAAGMSLGEAKAALGEDVSYGDLRLVIAWLRSGEQELQNVS